MNNEIAQAAVRQAYYFGMLKMPPNVKSHLMHCLKSPADCLVCKLIQTRIEDIREG